MPRPVPDTRRPVLWSWRPSLRSGEGAVGPGGKIAPGTRLSADAAVFHDARDATFNLRTEGEGLDLRVEGFDGGYLSFVFDLPEDALRLLGRGRLFECALDFRTRPALNAYLRLNLRYGAEPRRSVSALRPGDSPACTGFDLDNAANSDGLLQAWVEIIFDCSGAASVRLNDLVFWLAPRAEI